MFMHNPKQPVQLETNAFFPDQWISKFIYGLKIQEIFCTNEYIFLEILKYQNVFKYLQCKNLINLTNECINIFVDLNYKDKFYEWIYLLRNIQIIEYI